MIFHVFFMCDGNFQMLDLFHTSEVIESCNRLHKRKKIFKYIKKSSFSVSGELIFNKFAVAQLCLASVSTIRKM